VARLATQYFSGLSRNTFLLAFSSLFADISTEMLYPVLPVFLTQTLKASGSAVCPFFSETADEIMLSPMGMMM
jgi:hypothetical protein